MASCLRQTALRGQLRLGPSLSTLILEEDPVARFIVLAGL